MAVLPNTTLTTDFVKIVTIDFVETFGQQITTLLEAMGVTRRMPMPVGSEIQRYVKTENIVSGAVPEGDVIPLSKISYTEGDKITLELDKHRKLVTGEAIQQTGLEQTVARTDRDLVKALQKTIRNNFFTFLGTGTTTGDATNLQEALATAWGQLEVIFEDDAVDIVAFINPMTAASYLGSAEISTQTAFGMAYLESFLGVRTFFSSQIPQNVVRATAVDNIVAAYVDVTNGDLQRAFNLTSDDSGFIGVARDADLERLSIETVTVSGLTLFAEKLDGIANITITPGG